MTGFILFLPLLAARTHGTSLHLNFNLAAQPILALIAGALILVRPKLLNFIVAAYLIAVGLMGLFGLDW